MHRYEAHSPYFAEGPVRGGPGVSGSRNRDWGAGNIPIAAVVELPPDAMNRNMIIGAGPVPPRELLMRRALSPIGLAFTAAGAALGLALVRRNPVLGLIGGAILGQGIGLLVARPSEAQAAPRLPGPAPLPSEVTPLPNYQRQPGDLTYTPPPVIYPSPFVTRATVMIMAPTEEDAVFTFKERNLGVLLSIFEAAPYNWEITYAPNQGPV